MVVKFGRRLGGSGYWFSSIDFESCLSGQTQACTSLLGAHRATRAIKDDVIGLHSFYGYGYGRDNLSTILSRAEHEFGTKRFASFWQSQSDVPTAFQQAFGMDFGGYIFKLLRETYTVQAYSPRMSLATILSTLIVIAAIAAFTVFSVYRRAVT